MSEAKDLVRALGGPSNIDDVEVCMTRLRIEVRDSRLVDLDLVRASGALAVVAAGRVVQVVVGPSADDLAVKLGAELAGRRAAM